MSRLVRVLEVGESIDSSCAGPDGCDRDPSFRVATPIGEEDVCDDHVDGLIAALPPEWIGQFEERTPTLIDAGDDGIPF